MSSKKRRVLVLAEDVGLGDLTDLIEASGRFDVLPVDHRTMREAKEEMRGLPAGTVIFRETREVNNG